VPQVFGVEYVEREDSIDSERLSPPQAWRAEKGPVQFLRRVPPQQRADFGFGGEGGTLRKCGSGRYEWILALAGVSPFAAAIRLPDLVQYARNERDYFFWVSMAALRARAKSCARPFPQ